MFLGDDQSWPRNGVGDRPRVVPICMQPRYGQVKRQPYRPLFVTNRFYLLNTSLQACGYPERKSCAIVDAHHIVHLDLKIASSRVYHNLSFEQMMMHRNSFWDDHIWLDPNLHHNVWQHGRREMEIYLERLKEIGIQRLEKKCVQHCIRSWCWWWWWWWWWW